ncbi:DUF2516 family protein [Streptomyces sp. NPDC051776]|uniref:DUF2516 family protein n=1 Tax=Streptomyces sp. NPDC051776 TaxID=3155414 RepID=UPI00342F47E9
MLREGFNDVLDWLALGVLLFTGFAFGDALLRREDAFRAADKQTKPFWLIILGLAVVVNVFEFFFLVVIGLIAAIVYIVDVRPAIKSLPGGGRGGKRRGSSSDGPYGPFNGGR